MAGTGHSLRPPTYCCLRRSALAPPFSPCLLMKAQRLPPKPLRCRLSGIYAFSSNDIKVGTNIEINGAPWKVLDFLHVKPGKGAAFVRTKLRNYITGNTIEETFRAGCTIQEACISKVTKKYLYKDGSQFVFLDMVSYEEYHLSEKQVGEKKKWLKEGMDCKLLFWNSKVIDFEFPVTVKLKVVEVDYDTRGGIAQDRSQPSKRDLVVTNFRSKFGSSRLPPSRILIRAPADQRLCCDCKSEVVPFASGSDLYGQAKTRE